MAVKREEQNWLDMVPVPKNGIGTIINENGLASLVMPRFSKAWMAKLFLSKNKKNEIRINLEENGSSVWTLIDGKRTVRQILDELVEVGKEQEKYNDRVVLFLHNLYKNGYIEVKKIVNLF